MHRQFVHTRANKRTENANSSKLDTKYPVNHHRNRAPSPAQGAEMPQTEENTGVCRGQQNNGIGKLQINRSNIISNCKRKLGKQADVGG